MTWYLTDRHEYLAAGKALGDVYRELMTGAGGRVYYPAMTAVEVSALVEDGAKVEIEATAVVPD
jgi:enamine deaminase RidA (YjgF/YER057c/UK114 family)